MSSQPGPRKRVTVNDVARMKAAGEKIAVVTAYDATAARLVDDAGVDVILVGDSVGMLVQGHDSTLPVTLEHMIYHCAAVRRGLSRSAGRAHLVGDMPFGSYQASADEAVKFGFEPVRALRGQQRVEHVHRGGKQHGVAGLAGGVAQRAGEIGFV